MILDVLKANKPGVIYQDVQLPETGLEENDQPSDARSVGDVQLVEDDIGEPQASELLDGSCASRLVPGCQHDGDAAVGQLPAHLQPYPFVPAGHHGDPVPSNRKQREVSTAGKKKNASRMH